MTVVCDCRPFVFEKQFVCLCFSISDGAFNIGCDANLYQNGANKFPASCFIIVHNTGPINIAGCNLLCCLCLFLVTIFFVIFFRKDQKLPDVKDSVLKFFLTASLLPHLLWKLTKRVSFSGQLKPGIPNHPPVECGKYLLKILTFYGKPPSWSCAQNISLR